MTRELSIHKTPISRACSEANKTILLLKVVIHFEDNMSIIRTKIVILNIWIVSLRIVFQNYLGYFGHL